MAAMSASRPVILSVETSTELASVGVLAPAGLVTRESSGAQTHSASVLPMLQEVMAEAGVSLADCDAIAFGCGPGAFTGVRTACGLVQGLAFGAGRCVVPVVSLLAIADAARDAGAGDDLVAVLDARMGEVYWAQYRYVDNHWKILSEPALSTARQVAIQGSASLCGSGLLAYPEVLGALGDVTRFAGTVPHAASVARLAAAMLARGESLPAHAAQPLYLRDKIALTTRERIAAAAGSRAGVAV